MPHRIFSPPLAWLILLMVVSSRVALAADDMKEREAEAPEFIRPTQTVDLFRVVFSLSELQKLAKTSRERFPDFEPTVLYDMSDALADTDMTNSKHTAVGQRWGVYFPQEESFVGLVLPISAGDLLDDEDYALGEDEEGNAVVDGQRVVKTDHYYSLNISESNSGALKLAPEAAMNFLKFVQQNETYPLIVNISPTKIGRSPLKKHLVAYQMGLATDAQQRDDEEAVEYSWRSLFSKHNAKLVQTLFKDIENVEFKVKSDDPTTPVSIQIKIQCREKSDLLAYFQDMKKQRNRSLSWLHPSATSFATCRAALPETIQDQLKEAAKLTAEALHRMGEAPELASRLSSAASGVAEAGAVEILAQMVPMNPTSQAFVFVIPLNSSAGLGDEIIELVSGTESVDEVTRIDGWPVYPLPDQLELKESTVLMVSDSALIVACFAETQDDNEQALALLAEIARRDFSPNIEATRLAHSFAAFKTSVTDVIAVAGADSDISTMFRPANTDNTDTTTLTQIDQDEVRLTAGLNGNEVFLNLTSEPNAMAIGISCAEWILILPELIDW